MDHRSPGAQLVPPTGWSESARGKGQQRSDELHGVGKIRAGVFEANDRRLQVGVDHLRRKVDEVTRERRGPGLRQTLLRQLLNVGMTMCSVVQFNAVLRRRYSAVEPGCNARPNGAVARLVVARGVTPIQATVGRVGRGLSARGKAPRNITSATIASAGKVRRISKIPVNCPGSGSRKIRRRSSFSPRMPRLEPASRAGSATIRSWTSSSGARGTNRAPMSVARSR